MKNLALLVILIAACGSEGVPNGDAPPATKIDGGLDGSADLAPAGNTCPWQFPVVGIFACTQSCSMPSTEWGTLYCHCNAGRGVCCGSATLDACPSQIPKSGDPCCLGSPIQQNCEWAIDTVDMGASMVTCRCVPDGHWDCF
jgi:hypothetical protein